MTQETELAWAAGFFDGEGSVFTRHTARHKGGTTGKDYPLTTVEMSMSQIRIEPIARFLKAVGVGKQAGPYQQKNVKGKPYWRWSTAGRPSAHRVLSILWPYLSLPKQEQAHRVWAELDRLKTLKSPKLPPLPELNNGK